MAAGSDDIPTFPLDIAPGEVATVWVGRFDARHARVGLGAHAHEALQLLWFECGGGTHVLGDHAWEVRAGDLYLVPPGLVHDLAGLSTDARGWVMEFEPSALDAGGSLLLWRGNPLLNPFLVAQFDASAARLQVPDRDHERWRERFEWMERELRGGASMGRAEALRAWLQLAVVDVARLAADVPRIIADVDPLLAQVFGIIDRRFAAGIGPSDVASMVGFTTGHVSSLVRRRTGRTLQDWILERQMAEARRLLVTTELPVLAVAERCGHPDAGYFSRRFRSRHGVAPSQWRDAARSGRR